MIYYEFELRFPNKNISNVMYFINNYIDKTCENLKNAIEEVNNIYKICNTDLSFKICKNNYDLIVSGKFSGQYVKQDEFFKIISPFVRDYEIFVWIVCDEIIIIKWCNENGFFYTKDYILTNDYDEGKDDLPELEGSDLLQSFESYGMSFEDILNVLNCKSESDKDEWTSTEDEIEFENIEDEIDYYTSKNPYPIYEDMDSLLSNDIQLWSEYGSFNHEICEIIYKNITKKDIILECGRKIFIKGGKQSLLSNIKIIQQYSPFRKSLKNEIKEYPKILNIYLQEVIDWCGNN